MYVCMYVCPVTVLGYWGEVKLLPPTTKLGQGYIFTGVCDSVHRGGMCGCRGGGLGGMCGCQGGMRGCQGACVVMWGGVCMVMGGMCGSGGACMVAGGGHAWDTTRYGK